MSHPHIYQGNHAIAGQYSLDGHTAGFHLRRYDRTKTLVIDPTLVYSTYLGGSGYDVGYGIAVDASGDAYVTGTTSSNNFPTKNVSQAIFGDYGDTFVTELAPGGTNLVYSTYFGGSGYGGTNGLGIAIDTSGDAYVTGDTLSADFPTKNAFQATYSGYDAFVTELAPGGATLVYSTYFGGTGTYAYSIAVVASGGAYVTGFSGSIPIKNAFQATSGGFGDAFVTELAPGGADLVYSTYLGGSSVEEGLSIAIDAAGDAYVAGLTESPNFPTKNAFQSTSGGGSSDAFVTELAPSGGLVYSTYFGGLGEDEVHGIAIDATGDAYVVGETASTNFPTKNAVQATYGGGLADVFVSELVTSAPDTDLAMTTPANVTVPATGSSGAKVTYPLPPVVDEDGTASTPTCARASGSTFAIGTTTVTCSVSDADDTNSPVTTTFTVTVTSTTTTSTTTCTTTGPDTWNSTQVDGDGDFDGPTEAVPDSCWPNCASDAACTATSTITATFTTGSTSVPNTTSTVTTGTTTTTTSTNTTATIVVSGNGFVCTEPGSDSSTLTCFLLDANGTPTGSTSSVVVAAHALAGAARLHRIGADEGF